MLWRSQVDAPLCMAPARAAADESTSARRGSISNGGSGVGGGQADHGRASPPCESGASSSCTPSCQHAPTHARRGAGRRCARARTRARGAERNQVDVRDARPGVAWRRRLVAPAPLHEPVRPRLGIAGADRQRGDGRPHDAGAAAAAADRTDRGLRRDAGRDRKDGAADGPGARRHKRRLLLARRLVVLLRRRVPLQAARRRGAAARPDEAEPGCVRRGGGGRR